MGHLTEIANTLQTVAASRHTVSVALATDSTWVDFTLGPLAERNQVQYRHTIANGFITAYLALKLPVCISSARCCTRDATWKLKRNRKSDKERFRAMQLEDVLSWYCGHPQMRHVQPMLKADTDTEMPDLQLDALASLNRHADRLNAFSDDEDEEELRSLYLVCTPVCFRDYCFRFADACTPSAYFRDFW